jgi:hypothetical protein
MNSDIGAGLAKPVHVTSLNTTAILVAVRMKLWSATKQDRETTTEVTNAKHADKDAARVTQQLLANNVYHRRILSYRQIMYSWLKSRAYPWSGDFYILPVVNYVQFRQEFAEHELMFKKLIEEFKSKYPEIVTELAFKMGEFFKRENYPAVEDLDSMFTLGLDVMEVPQGDFRVLVAYDLRDDLHNFYNKQHNRQMAELGAGQVNKLAEVLEHISTICTVDETPDGKVKKKRVHESMLDKAREAVDEIKKFNPTANEALDEACMALEKVLDNTTLEVLRESISMRKTVKDDVDEILKKFRPIGAA